MRKPLSQRQHLDAEILCVSWDTTASPVLTYGKHHVTAERSNSGGMRDRMTLTFVDPIFAAAPLCFPMDVDASTQSCWKVVSTSLTTVVLDCVQNADGATAVGDAEGAVMLFGPTYNKHGKY